MNHPEIFSSAPESRLILANPLPEWARAFYLRPRSYYPTPHTVEDLGRLGRHAQMVCRAFPIETGLIELSISDMDKEVTHDVRRQR